ncbi:MAG TPA: hypothetical protein DCM05_11065 [Elusimicrobia bacterium]|nr:hypothetical protein [Elusimicrobiota bacterium]
MRRSSLALLTFCAAASAWAAIGYARFAHPKGDYAVEYPSDWKKSYGIQALRLAPPGKAGEQVKLTLERYPFGKESPATMADFARSLLEQVPSLKKLDSDVAADVAGRKARRLAFTETATLRTKQGDRLAGPMREVVLLVPVAKGWYVVKLAGLGREYDKALPEFEHLVKTAQFEVKPAKTAPKKP